MHGLVPDDAGGSRHKKHGMPLHVHATGPCKTGRPWAIFLGVMVGRLLPRVFNMTARLAARQKTDMQFIALAADPSCRRHVPRGSGHRPPAIVKNLLERSRPALIERAVGFLPMLI